MEYEYDALDDQQLWKLVAYNAEAIARQPPELLARVREDGLQAAEIVVPAAEYLTEELAELL